MKTTYHVPANDHYPAPKRGDILQSNIGKKTERTWLILGVKELPMKVCKEMGEIMTRRWKLWAERWWDLEPETRVALWKSAERAGGQVVHGFQRFPAKRKAKTFNEYLSSRTHSDR